MFVVFLADVKIFVDKPSQKGKERKKSKSDSFCEQKKNKKEMEFEQKLAKEKEGMLEKEKQLKINRLVQEVCCDLSSAKLY